MVEVDSAIYVISGPQSMSDITAERIKKFAETQFPGKKFLVLSDGLELYRVPTVDTTTKD